MKSTVSIFTFEEGLTVRTVVQDGEPWFVAMDVAKALDYGDTEAMTRRLDDDEKQNRRGVGFGPRGITVINESGLYAAILGSRKPEAKRFRKWVTGDVLPAIRKTGQYQEDHTKARSHEVGANKVMASALEMIRREKGKATQFFHYANEHKLINWVLTGDFSGIDHDALSVEDLELRTHLAERNVILMARDLDQKTRKPMLKQYAMDFRMARTAPQRLGA